MGETRIYLLPDTNIFLHFMSLNQVDLCKIAKSKSVIIVITKPLLDELDKKKYDSRKNIRKRAKSSLSLISNWLDNKKITKDVLITSHLAPSCTTLDRLHLNIHSPDDWMIASAIELAEIESTTPIAILTNDTGMKLKASTLSVNTIDIPEQYQLRPISDKLQRENLKLKKELTNLTSKQPKPVIRFCETHTDSIQIMLTESQHLALDAPAQQAVDRTTNKCTNKSSHSGYKEKSDKSQNTDQTSNTASNSTIELIRKVREDLGPIIERMESRLSIPVEEIERYQNEYIQYNKQYDMYLEEYYVARKKILKILPLRLELYNSGGCVATDMRIQLTLPSRMVWRVISV